MSLLRPLTRLTICSFRRVSASRSLNALSTIKFRSRSFKPLIWGAAGLFAGSLTLRPPIKLDSEQHVTSDEVVETIADPATGIHFPTTLRVPAKLRLPQLSLVGVGVRTVSFLGIKVYSVGFYADLNSPNLQISKHLTPDQKIEQIVRNTACVIRIVPTRTTSYTHLRDAFMRSLQSRMAMGRQRGTISEEVEQAAGSPMRKLKSLFPNSSLTKHTPFDIFLTPPTLDRPRALVFRDMGAVENDWVATELVLAYFEGDGPSPALKKSVTAHLESFEK